MIKRIESIDILRGIVMILMVLDHTRDFVAPYTALQATNIKNTTPILFFTRWITHICAPTFVFLAGLACYLQKIKGKKEGELSKYLFMRGLWLIILEITWVYFFIFLPFKNTKESSFNFIIVNFIWLQVLWAIGISMISLSILIYLPLGLIMVGGLIMIVFHNLFDNIEVFFGNYIIQALWLILHKPGSFRLFGQSGPTIYVLYPVIPWIGVMAIGYASGIFYEMEEKVRQRFLFVIGVSAACLFIILRFINYYGDPSTWAPQNSLILSVLSFLNTTKYPPSFLFLLMTLGPALLLLYWFEHSGLKSNYSRIYQLIITFGHVPLFFYLCQWPIAHFNAILINLISGKPIDYLFMTPASFLDESTLSSKGLSLGMVYVTWIINILTLYPLCKWFSGIKARYKKWWLSYL